MKDLTNIGKEYVLDTATVIKITGNKAHVRSLTTGRDYFKTSIGAIIETADNHLSVYPKKNTTVVIGVYERDNAAVILQVSEVEKVYFKIGTTELKADKEGFVLNREGENLKTVLNEFQVNFGKLCDELAKVIVSIGVTPNVSEITKIKEAIVQANMENLNTILR